MGRGRRTVDAGYAAAFALTRHAPEPVARVAFAAIADTATRRDGRRVRQLRRNLARVCPDLSERQLGALTRAAMRSYLRYWREVFRLPALSPAQLLAAVVDEGRGPFDAALAEGRGVVSPLAHTGNWDLAGAWAVVSGYPLTTVAERLRPEHLFDRFVAYRQRLGLEVLPLSGGPDPFPILADRLRAGRLVCLVADRDLTGRGVVVDFFGAKARLPAGPAALAVRTGAALIPITTHYAGPVMRLTFHERIRPPAAGRSALAAMTQRVADVFAATIAAHPADWHMLQPYWLDDLARRAAQAGGPAGRPPTPTRADRGAG